MRRPNESLSSNLCAGKLQDLYNERQLAQIRSRGARQSGGVAPIMRPNWRRDEGGRATLARLGRQFK